MRTGAQLVIATCLTIAGLPGPAALAEEGPIRYQGQYTVGHEVNVFCPVINSQCYWLSGDTLDDVRANLRGIFDQHSTEPYEAVCMVVEAEIDRDTVRSGFAADYDGLARIVRVFGQCTDTSIVTQGDLQHHRWILESVNGDPLPVDELHGKIPDLEIGEQMMATGNSGCNRISGRAVLREEFFMIDGMISTRMSCAPPQNELERLIQSALTSESVIRLDDSRNLLLESTYGSLRFRLQDWVE